MPLLKPCPFCGKKFQDDDLDDVLYPTYRYKIDEEGFAKVIPMWDRQEEDSFLGYGVHCHVHNFGCGAMLEADSKQEVIKRWNRRYNDTRTT